MVLEHLFPENWIEKKARYSFILAFVYATLSIVVSRFLFGANSGIVSVMFTSILLLPYLRKVFKKEERKEKKEKKFTLKALFKDNKPALTVYVSFFFGVYLTYMLYSFLLPQFGYNTTRFFGEQLMLDSGLSGGATFIVPMFFDILMNNWWVLLACFMLALLTGDGAIFFITWNASSWGILFGTRALLAASASGESAWMYLFLIFLITLPHVLIEGLAYILAAISGSVISDDIIEKSREIRSFIQFAALGGFIFIALRYIMRSAFTTTAAFTAEFLIVIMLVRQLGSIFTDKKHKEVFVYNYWLFIIAIAFFLVGAAVETFVLSTSDTLALIYQLSLG